jgi:hypothetical protein
MTAGTGQQKLTIKSLKYYEKANDNDRDCLNHSNRGHTRTRRTKVLDLQRKRDMRRVPWGGQKGLQRVLRHRPHEMLQLFGDRLFAGRRVSGRHVRLNPGCPGAVPQLHWRRQSELHCLQRTREAGMFSLQLQRPVLSLPRHRKCREVTD